MKSLSRSRSLRGNSLATPVEPPVKEREPFFVGPFRQQKNASLPSTPGRNRSRANGENVPPDCNHTAATAAYVKANTPTADTASPAQPKSSKKGRNAGAVPLPGSPALLPRPPSGKPSPAGPKLEAQVAPGQDNMTAKRKLHWDVSGCNSSDNVGLASVVDTAGSDSGVKVILRMRPLNEKEQQEAATKIVHKVSSDAVTLGDQQFTYDAIAGEGASQEGVFEMVGSSMVENCLAGFNSSIFAYGQTGSGKTHTMMGLATDPNASSLPSDQRGLTPRVIERLFSRMQEEEEIHVDKELSYQCRCSFLEIYNEQITDLLDPTQRNLQIREDTKTGVYVDNLSEEFVSNVDDVTRLLLKGLTNRTTGATIMNSESSRSHSVFTCVIESRFKNLAEGGSSVRSSRMNLVDLAGSERQKQSGVAGERLKEAGNINKSLSQLGNVINILAEVAQTGRPRHIPYRDSRLTFLLQESLGGNAKLAMICAISPASSCRSETLSTLRFAQRAKAIQNKAVVNEETSSDVGLLREQIRQLKDELMRMKTNKNSEGAAGGYSNSWNARRSYNLLRLSLSHPMILSAADLEEPDTEMEIEENEKEPERELAQSVLVCKDTSQYGSARLPVIDEKTLQEEKFDITGSESGVADVVDELLEKSDPTCSGHQSLSLKGDSKDSGHESLLNIDDDSVNLGSEMTESPGMVGTPELMRIPDLIVPRALHSPPQSVSPRLKGTSKRNSSGSPLGPGRVVTNFVPSNSMCEEIYHSTQERFYDSTNTSQALQVNNDPRRPCSMRASISIARPTEKLAACLQRGLQILDSHQRSSGSFVRRSTAGLRSSAQTSDLYLPRMVDKFDKAVQTSGTVLVTTSTSPIAQNAPEPAVIAHPGCNLFLTLADDSLPTEVSRFTSSPNLAIRDSRECEGHLQETCCTESLISVPKDAETQLGLPATEDFLQGVSHEVDTGSDSDNSCFHSSIVCRDYVAEQPEDEHRPQSPRRLEDLPGQLSLDDVPSSSHYTPSATASIKVDTANWQLVALGCPESSTPQSPVQELATVSPSSSTRQRRLSLARISVQTTKLAEVVTDRPSPSSLALLSIPLEEPEGLSIKPSSDLSMVPTEATVNDPPLWEDASIQGVSSPSRCWEDEKREMESDWEERERDWMAVLEELREEAEYYKGQRERKQKELDCEKRSSDEMRDALQMAMTGHARLLEQYVELQEKHIMLLAKHRKIKEGTVDLRKMAKKAGVTSLESRWLDAQALQTVSLKVELEEEREKSKEEIESLKAQLHDTADAVQAAGELLVRLKEAEEAALIAEDGATMAEQEVHVLRGDIEKIRRRHAIEVATLQQRVLESRLQKTAVCPMCVMAERVKFQFTEVDSETAQAELEAEARAKALKEEQEWMDQQKLDIAAEYQNEQYEHPPHMQNLSAEYHSQQRERSPKRQQVAAENQSHQDMHVGGTDWTGDLENQVDDFEIDHFFTHS